MLGSLTYEFDLLDGSAKNLLKTFEVGAVGLRLTATVKEGIDIQDISAADTIDFCAIAPSGAIKSFAGTFVTDGTDGQFYYDTAAVDFDENGTWRIAINVADTGVYDRKSPGHYIQLVTTSLCP